MADGDAKETKKPPVQRMKAVEVGDLPVGGSPASLADAVAERNGDTPAELVAMA